MAERSPVVEVAQGKVRGSRADVVDRFLGLPFAAPPIGDLRFRPPAAAPGWSGVREATRFGAEAPQDSTAFDARFGPSGQAKNEDCLTLNVWRPADAGSGLPVMVFVHGGAFLFGGAGHPCFDGAALARRGGVVVVTLQYRLGILGLLWHPALADGADAYEGNWTLQDLIVGLRWVHENIAAFGGDAGNLTLFGESAGGVAVAQLCLSPVVRPLIRRAIVQSASPNIVTRDQHLRAAEAFLAEAGMPADPAALRAMPVEAVLRAQPAWAGVVGAGRAAPRPMLDGELVPDWPNAVADRGDLRRLDIMVTYCRDEFTFFALALPTGSVPQTDAALRRTIEAAGLPASLIAVYREAREARGEPADPASLWVALKTDHLVRVPALDFLARHAAAGGRGYACAITWESEWRPPELGGRALGAGHTIELPPLFGTCDSSPAMTRLAGTAAKAAGFAALTQDAWLAFARDGRPRTDGAEWPAFDTKRRATMCLGATADLVSDPWGTERQAMSAALQDDRAAAD